MTLPPYFSSFLFKKAEPKANNNNLFVNLPNIKCLHNYFVQTSKLTIVSNISIELKLYTYKLYILELQTTIL